MFFLVFETTGVHEGGELHKPVIYQVTMSPKATRWKRSKATAYTGLSDLTGVSNPVHELRLSLVVLSILYRPLIFSPRLPLISR
jgi:hypothetical protein